MRYIFLLSIIANLSACATITNDWESVHPVTSKPSQEEAQLMAQEAISKTMFDPESAKFRNWSPIYKTYAGILMNEPVWAICVEVNGKNQYGGYAGFRSEQVFFENNDKQGISASASDEEYGCPVYIDPKRQ